MDQKEIDRIVQEFRETVCAISDDEVKEVIDFCKRKMALTGQKDDYMKLLLPDELKNYLFRRSVNATTILRQMKREGMICVQCAGVAHA